LPSQKIRPGSSSYKNNFENLGRFYTQMDRETQMWEKKLEISFCYHARTTYNMWKNEKVTSAIIQLFAPIMQWYKEENDR
jgi:meiotically up-regulated gene 157 (Mug157) protein